MEPDDDRVLTIWGLLRLWEKKEKKTTQLSRWITVTRLARAGPDDATEHGLWEHSHLQRAYSSSMRIMQLICMGSGSLEGGLGRRTA